MDWLQNSSQEFLHVLATIRPRHDRPEELRHARLEAVYYKSDGREGSVVEHGGSWDFSRGVRCTKSSLGEYDTHGEPIDGCAVPVFPEGGVVVVGQGCPKLSGEGRKEGVVLMQEVVDVGFP